MATYLCADLGGTNANLSLVKFDTSAKIIAKKEAKTQNITDICSYICLFLSENKDNPEHACFSVAGTINNHSGKQFARLTNSSLAIDSRAIVKNTSLKTLTLINDFEAIGYATNIIKNKDIMILNKGRPQYKGCRAVIGAGTGLGKNILYFDKTSKVYTPLPSEGGHAMFPINNQEEFKLIEFIKKKKKRNCFVEIEDIVSGHGLELIYEFYAKSYKNAPGKMASKEIASAKNSCAKKAFEMFLKFYARTAKNFCLETLATGGLYIAGGIAAKNHEKFGQKFLQEFLSHDRFSKILNQIPVKIIKNYDISHLGAAFIARLKD